MRDDSTTHRVEAAVQSHARPRREWDAERAIEAVTADPQVRRLSDEIQREEERLGLELRPRYQALQDAYDRAEQGLDGDIDVTVLTRTCHGKHGRWGRICVLLTGHEATDPHWGTTKDGRPVAWLGSAPDDD
ncbi:hypothetical protein [Streptomyces sp. NPDC056987]|uniref:hypothetical protein n=1 Tax=Streptomyces sp. NPDC056987 TaxID=3345988 RepID=UPI00364447BE